MKNIWKLIVLLALAIFCKSCSELGDELKSPNNRIHVEVFNMNDEGLTYIIYFDNEVLIDTSRLGILVDHQLFGEKVKKVTLLNYSNINLTYPLLGVKKEASYQANLYIFEITELSGFIWTLEFQVSNEGIAYRYIIPGNSKRTVYGETSSFKLPDSTKVWYFERNNDWKLKSHAGEWLNADISKMPTISEMGQVQGLPLTLELPNNTYALIAEAGLYNYSGLRLKAIGSNTFVANFSEGEKGFEIDGEIKTPWRTILLAQNLNDLVNNTMISSLNPAPDKKLFEDRSWIKPGKSVWRWWSRGTGSFEQELQMIDNAVSLGFEYSLIDEGWELWDDKWEKLTQLVDYAKSKDVGVMVWKHSKQLNFPKSNYEIMSNFVDSVSLTGVVGIKVDFINGHSKPLIDFDENLLIQAAKRKLMVNFHGCQQSSGESRTYPNEINREGIRGGELNIMEQGPIPAFHNAALPFTRFITGHADYTPLCFTHPGATSWAHQLATLVCFYSPVQCIAENTEFLLNNKQIQPVVGLISKIPSVWDETIVLEGSKIGDLAMIARRKGKDWYIAVINGADERTIQVDCTFSNFSGYRCMLYSDDFESERYDLELSSKKKFKGHFNPLIIQKKEIEITNSIKVKLADAGGCLIHFYHQ